MRPLGVELAALLADRGVEVVFGIPGVHNIEMYRGIEEAGITHVLARHEQGAGFMADGYARASRKLGVCFVITGPGLTNIMTPMGQAYSDSVPILVISSCLDETAAKRGQLHQMRDQEGAGRTVCAWSETARTPGAAYELVDRAFRGFFAGERRPCHIQVPISVLGGPAPSCRSIRFARGEGRVVPEPLNVGTAAHLLKAARKPLFIFGGGARDLGVGQTAEARPPIHALLSALPAAAFTTYAGRGVVPPDYPLLFGSNLARSDSARIVAEADLIVVIGSELAEVDLGRDHLGHTAKMIRVDVSERALGRNVNAFFNIRADAASFAAELLKELKGEKLAYDWTPGEVAAARARWRAAIDAERPGLVPICDALRQAIPDDTMIFSDMTQFAYAAKEVWDMPTPGLWHHPYGFGTLGYALPAAIGGQIARPGKPTLAIIGDYGIQYTIQELGAMTELGLSIPILLWDNDALAEIRDCMVEAQIAPNAVHAKNPDWAKLSDAYGCGFAEPDNVAALCEAVTAAFSAGRPTLVRATPKISSSS